MSSKFVPSRSTLKTLVKFRRIIKNEIPHWGLVGLSTTWEAVGLLPQPKMFCKTVKEAIDQYAERHFHKKNPRIQKLEETFSKRAETLQRRLNLNQEAPLINYPLGDENLPLISLSRSGPLQKTYFIKVDPALPPSIQCYIRTKNDGNYPIRAGESFPIQAQSGKKPILSIYHQDRKGIPPISIPLPLSR